MTTSAKSVILGAAGALLLGGTLLLSSVGASSRANAHPDYGRVIDKTCDSDNYCFVEDNYGTRGALNGESEAANSIAILGGSGGTGGTGVWASVFDGFPLVSVGTSTTDAEFYTDSSGDGVFDGAVYAAGFEYDVRNSQGTRVGASVALAPRTTIEDSGTARMTDGLGVVRFDPAFAHTLDLRSGYQVFLTPDGDTRGLYVAQKYEGGFVVRENEHGRSSVDFDYRILAHPIGTSEARLPALNLKRPPARP